jgi:hypothetical protein
MGWPPRASIERTDRMLVYGSSKPSSLLLTVVWLSPLLLWLWGREKLDGDPQIGQLMCWRCSQEFLFLGSSDSVQLYWQLRKRFLYMDRVRYVWSRAIRGLSVENMWHVGRVFPCRVYIDSNYRDSKILVPLVRGSLHIVIKGLMFINELCLCLL